MSFLQHSMYLSKTSHPETSGFAAPLNGRKSLRSKLSLSSLVYLARNPVGVVGEAVEGWRDGLTPEQRAEKQRVDTRKQILYCKLRNAASSADWHTAAIELDELEGNNEWKKAFESPDCDSELIESRLKQLDQARLECDVGRMLFLIRTALTRGLGDMGNLNLYKHSHVGTKDIIERYITSALATLDALLDISAKADCDGIETRYILEQVLSSRQAFGRSALLLSGGATFGMNHIGVLKTLWEQRLLPRIISGASAGSIVCAVLCTRTDQEMPELLNNFCDGDLAVFEEEGNEDSVLRKLARFLKFGALFDISHLVRVMKEMLGDLTFQEAYNRTRRILNICVSSASLYELPRLLNYVTSPNVLIWSAVAASCSVPFIFSPASILAKDPRTGEAHPWNPSPQRWIDGSVDNDLPMNRLAEMFNVNHFIVSQVNPHVVPFLDREEDSLSSENFRPTSTEAAVQSWLSTITDLAKGEALHRMRIMAELGIFPNMLTKTVSVLSQKYSGDITILPEISYSEFPYMLSNPTPEFMREAMLRGQRATWPKLSRIRNHCAIELALDGCVQKLRTRVVFSPSQIDLRLDEHSRVTSEAQKRKLSRRFPHLPPRPLSLNASLDPPATPQAPRNVVSLKHHHKSLTATAVSLPLAIPMDSGSPPLSPTSAVPSLFSPHSYFFNSTVNHSPFDPKPFSTPLPTTHKGLPTPPQKYRSLSFPTNDNEEQTSHITTSSDSDFDNPSSSSLDSPDSPASPNLPALWPTGRPLFPYYSQPATPSLETGNSFLPLLTPLQSAPSAVIGGVSAGVNGKQLSYPPKHTQGDDDASEIETRSILPAKRISLRGRKETPMDGLGLTHGNPEAMCKRLFHGNGSKKGSDAVKVGEMTDGSDVLVDDAQARNSKGQASKRLNALGLELDISGTRGMVLRRRKSEY